MSTSRCALSRLVAPDVRAIAGDREGLDPTEKVGWGTKGRVVAVDPVIGPSKASRDCHRLRMITVDCDSVSTRLFSNRTPQELHIARPYDLERVAW
jgi:hypothetical protein